MIGSSVPNLSFGSNLGINLAATILVNSTEPLNNLKIINQSLGFTFLGFRIVSKTRQKVTGIKTRNNLKFEASCDAGSVCFERKNTFYSNSFAFICTKVKICIATASLTHHWSHHSIHPQYKCPGVFSCCK